MIVFLDACAVIYLIEAEEPFHGHVTSVLRDIRTAYPEARLGISRLSLLECLVKPVRDGDQTLIDEYRAFFSARDLIIVEIGPAVIEAALLIRAVFGLRTPDAIQAACALASKDEECFFLTNDGGFERVSGLDVRMLSTPENP